MKKSSKFPSRDQVEEFSSLVSQFERKISLTLQILEPKLGISPIQFKFLNQIAANPGISSSELVNQFALNKATVSLHIEKMKIAGVIEQKSGTRDRRQKNLYLTESGTQLIQKMTVLRHMIMRSIVKLLGPTVLNSTMVLMEQILNGFDDKLQRLSTFVRTQERKGRLFMVDIPDNELLSELQALFPLLFDI